MKRTKLVLHIFFVLIFYIPSDLSAGSQANHLPDKNEEYLERDHIYESVIVGALVGICCYGCFVHGLDPNSPHRLLALIYLPGIGVLVGSFVDILSDIKTMLFDHYYHRLFDYYSQVLFDHHQKNRTD